MILNYYLVYRFIRMLTTPFTDWSAFATGVIDKDGNVVVKKRDRTTSQSSSFGIFENLVRNIKLTLSKLPGGNSKLASFAAAMFLIKEHNMFMSGSILNESEIPEVDMERVGRFVEEVVTSAIVDGTGVMSRTDQTKWRKKNAED